MRSLLGLLLALTTGCGVPVMYLSDACHRIRIGDTVERVLDACGAADHRTPGYLSETWLYGHRDQLVPRRAFTFTSGVVSAISVRYPRPDARQELQRLRH